MNPRLKNLHILLAVVLGIGLTGAVLGSLLRVPVVFAAHITVDSADDELNSDGDCSLREAIRAANLDTAVDNCGPGSGHDIIQFSLPAPSVITLTQGHLHIKTDPLTISGPGAEQLTIRGNDASRIFDITTGAAVTLSGMTLQDGKATLNGGAVRSDGPLTILDAVLVNNSAGSDGGAVDVTGSLTLKNTDILSNTANGEGGGVKAFGLQTWVTNGRFENNRSGSFGGGLYANEQLTISGTQFISNTANQYAGGVWASDEASITAAHFERNRAKFLSVGALYVRYDFQLTASTFISNTAAQNIGAVWANGDAAVEASIFAGNVAGTSGSSALQVNGSLGITNTEFLLNQAAAPGGALMYLGGNGRFVNLLFARNQGGSAAFKHSGNVEILHGTFVAPKTPTNPAIAVDATGTLSVQNSIFSSYPTAIDVQMGTVGEDYNLFHATIPVGGAVTQGGHSYSGDPAFVDAVSGNYHLSASSEALNTAVDVGVSIDGDGDGRPGGGGRDIGYDETPFTSDVLMTKAAFSTPGPSQPVAYTLTFVNAGTAMLPRLTITDHLPVWVVAPITISSNIPITNSGGSMPTAWQVHNLAPGASGTITISAVLSDVLPYGLITNTAKISTIAAEVNTANNIDHASINVPNIGPVAVDDVVTTDEDVTAVFNPTANDIDGDVLLIDSFTPPTHGTAVLSGTQVIVYTPTLEFSGIDMIEYTISDGQSTDTAAITITVTVQNDAPIISEGAQVTVTMSEDSSPTSFNLALNASDAENSPLSWSVAAEPDHGTATTAAGPANSSAVSYTPTAHYFGVDQFVVQVSDGELTDTVVISVTIESVNDAPAAVEDTAVLLRKPSGNIALLATGSSGTMNVLENDSDVDDTALSVTQVGMPDQGGAVMIQGDGTVLTYVPVTHFTGMETFTYTVQDGTLSDTAVVSMTVTEGIDGGIGGDTFTVPEMGNDHTFTVTIEVPPNVANGENVALVFDDRQPVQANAAANLEAPGLSFNLLAYLDGQLMNEMYQFEQPVTVTIRYANANVTDIGPSENSLMIHFATLNGWSTSGVQVVERDSEHDRVTFAVSHPGAFTLFRQGFLFLPLLTHNYVEAPDLIVESVTVLSPGSPPGIPGNLELVIANVGNAPVIDEFWVDLYLNPKSAPTAVNQTWEMMGSQGYVWGITSAALPLQPGERLTLTLSSPYARPLLSHIVWPLASNVPIDVQVDSANPGFAHGAVRELHEIRGEPYNNIRRFYTP